MVSCGQCDIDKWWVTLSPKSHVPFMSRSPNKEARSQLLSLKKPLQYGLYLVQSNLDYFMQNYSKDLCWEFILHFAQSNSQHKSQTSPRKKMLSCKHPCHTWDLGLGTSCEVVSLNFHALISWDCMDWPQVTWDLRPV